jgi:hypothetical protein
MDQQKPEEIRKADEAAKEPETARGHAERERGVPPGPIRTGPEETRRLLEERQRRMVAVWRRLVTVFLSAAVILLSVHSYQQRKELEALRGKEPAGAAAQVQRTKAAAALVPAAAESAAFGMAAFVGDGQGSRLLVQAEKLPQPKGAETYQVWLYKDGKPESAGTFLPSGGTGGLSCAADPQGIGRIAVTLEPDAGGSRPRGREVLSGELAPRG